jgi:hypothetical protein
MIEFISTSVTISVNHSHNTIAILHTLQSLHTNLLCPNLYSSNLHISLTASSRTALLPIRISTAHRLLISLHYGTLKVFQSHSKSSQADFFDYELPAAISYRQLLLLPAAHCELRWFSLIDANTLLFYSLSSLHSLCTSLLLFCQLPLMAIS